MLKILTYKYLVCALLFLLAGSVLSQTKSKHFSVYTGMGVSLTNSSSLNDYLRNTIPSGSGDTIKSFSTAIEFFGGLEYELSKKFSLKVDYAYFFRSMTYSISFLTYDYFYYIHQPYLIANYSVKGNRYKINMGAGAGYMFGTLSEAIYSVNEKKYSSSGLAVKTEVVISLALSNNFYSYISGSLSNSFMSSLKDSNGNKLTHSNGKEVNLSSFNAGVRLGVLVYLF